MNFFLIVLGKFISQIVKFLNLGAGSTWPGHIALKVNPYFIHDILKHSHVKTILIAGTNGKTTTAKLIATALEANKNTVLQNDSGANLLNGIASILLSHATFSGKINFDYAIFEVDENTLPQLLKQITPNFVVLLNLFRDQLDRYGEVNSIVTNWKDSLEKLSTKTMMILNADDPQIAYLAKSTKAQSKYFGLQPAQFGNAKLQHSADSVYCPKCGEKLTFKALAFSHLGDWQCKKCGLKRPEIEDQKFAVYPLPGLYNKYNVLAAMLVLKALGLTDQKINFSFAEFEPAFGRQEMITYKNKQVQIFLSKNPTSFNESYTTIRELRGKTLLLVLNDRVPDGRDISWIWDVDLGELTQFNKILISGDRVYDMALRLKYDDYTHFQTFENLADAIEEGIKHLAQDETLFILPTYSAMLEVRKIITGKKIL